MLLALHGADVIKIEPPEGDWGRALGELKGDHCAPFGRLQPRASARSRVDPQGRPDGKAVVAKLAAKAQSRDREFSARRHRPAGLRLRGTSTRSTPASSTVRCRASARPVPTASGPTVDGLIQAFSGHDGDEQDAGRHTRGGQGMIAVDVTTGLYTFQALGAGADAPTALRRRPATSISSLMRFGGRAYQGAKLMEMGVLQGHAAAASTCRPAATSRRTATSW